ncbi:MAG TPA: pitrilysin family protein [Pyrinomonadaceae bacterium]|jgi:zinc protease|nr:pitrilysin family protein [Pyrinomonadaceae bacterium]
MMPDNQLENFRRQPPAPLAPRPLNLPTPEETTLANGLRVVLVENARLPLVTYRLALRTGDAHDPPDLPGLTDILTGMLNEGTETRTSRRIAEDVARIGATLGAGAGSDNTTVAASALSQFNDQILDLMADITLRPSFPEDELELTKQNALQNLIAQRGQPSFLANERLARVIYGEHPYSVVSATPESIEAMSRDDLIRFHRRRFIPNNAVLVVGGDIRRADALRRIEELFGAWQPGEPEASEFPAPPARTRRTLYLVDRPGSAQSNIIIANAAITRTDPDYFPMLVMHTVLGANASSRIFMNLREDKGYTYGAYTSLDARRTAGSFRATAEVRTPVTGDSLKEFFYEFARIREERVTEKELRDAQNYLTGIFPIRLETLDGLIDQLIQIKMHDLPDDYLQTYRERVSAVTREEVQRVARRYVTPDIAAIVVVGDADALADEIKGYADEMEIYDSAGQRKDATVAERAADETTTNGSHMSSTSTTGDQAGFVGSWQLEITSPLGPQTATLVVDEEGGALRGRMSSSWGEAPLDTITQSGDIFNAAIALKIQGMAIQANIEGRREGDNLSGSIRTNMPIVPPLMFTGRRIG